MADLMRFQLFEYVYFRVLYASEFGLSFIEYNLQTQIIILAIYEIE